MVRQTRSIDMFSLGRGLWRRCRVSEWNVPTVVAILIFLTVAALDINRLKFGVDHTDEAWYATLSERFALGDRPFYDERDLRMLSGYFAMPLCWIYLNIIGSTDGIVYALRFWFFILQCGVAWSIYLTAQAFTQRRAISIVIASLPLAFVPFSIPACSYNTIGGSLLTIGIALALRADSLSRRWLFLCAGATHALATVAYPTLGPVVIALGICLHWSRIRLKSCWWTRPMVAYWAGAAGVWLVVGAAIAPNVYAGAAEAVRISRLGASYNELFSLTGVVTKGLGLFARIDETSPARPLTLLTGGLVWFLGSRTRLTRRVVPSLVILQVVWWFTAPRAGAERFAQGVALELFMMIFLGLVAPILLALMPDREQAKSLFLLGWVPSAVGGLLMGISAANPEGQNMGVGLFPAAVVGAIALPLILPKREAGDALGQEDLFLSMGVVAVISAAMTLLNYIYVYRDETVAQLTARVESGPYRGLYTTRSTAQQIESLCPAVRKNVKWGDRIIVYYDWPAAFLCAPIRPALPSTWIAPHPVLVPQLQMLHEKYGYGSLVLAVRGSSAAPEFEQALERPEALVTDAGWFKIYRDQRAEKKKP